MRMGDIVRRTLVSSVIMPVADRIRGRRLSATRRFLDESQWWPTDKLRRHQTERLRSLLRFAADHVPYHADTIASAGLAPEAMEIEDLRRLPLLTRERIRTSPHALTASGVDTRGWYQGRTGGSSTGEPLFFKASKGTLDYGRASYYRGMSWTGAGPGTAMIELWGQPVRHETLRTKLRDRAVSLALGISRANAFAVDAEMLGRCARLLERGRVRYIYAYVSALEELCRHLEGRGIRPRGLIAAMTTAEVLTDETRAHIEKILGIRLFNGYGCGEVNGIAYECDRHEGLHVAMERAIVEIVDDTGEVVPEGVVGRIALTDLHNRAMPLIRYLNGDEASLVTEVCSCGRHLVRLARLAGRTCDIIDGVNGRKVHSYYFASLFGHLGWAQSFGLTRFQIVQESAEVLKVRLATDTEVPEPELGRLLGLLQEYLGPMTFVVECPAHFESHSSGKFRWTLNRTRT